MNNKRFKLTAVQITTLVLIILYLIWEKNVQQYAQAQGIENVRRADLLFIVPVIAILLAISIWQWYKKR